VEAVDQLFLIIFILVIANILNDFAKKDTLVIIGRLAYPGNTAVSNRVHLYCKALKNEGGFPFIINLHSTFTKKPKFGYLARNEGIPFYYAQKTPVREKRFLLRNINKSKGIFNTIFLLRKLKKKHPLKVLLFNTNLWDELLLFIFLKMMKITIVRECNEIPSIVDEKRFRSYHHFLLKLKVKMYNNVIVISDQLNYFYSSILPKDRIIQIPILVDLDRFKNVELKEHPGKIITYVGYMGGNKDGLENLIDAMALVKKKNEKVTLQLVGSAPEKDMIRLKNKVKTLGLNDTITFLGKKNAEEVPSILLNSDFLVLARPNSSQAKAGFPTKLGEYLASGKPVIITITGEIPKYLTDKESAYLSKPDDIVDFADKLVYALSDENAEKIGREGYKIARNNFNYQLYGKKLFDFLQN